MQTQKPVALLAAGRFSSSFLMRMPRLAERIGPVGSTSLRLASRFSNLLNAGHPVAGMTAIADCQTILISCPMPEYFVKRILEERSADWKGKALLLCDSALGSESLAAVKSVGISAASLTPVEGADGGLFVAEGCRPALKSAKWLLEGAGAQMLRVNAGEKALYSAGVCLATSLALPLVAAAAETLRASGLSANQALEVTERLIARTLRSYRKAGRNGWEGPVPRGDVESMSRQLHALAASDPAVAHFYYNVAAVALNLFKQDTLLLSGFEGHANGKVRARA